LGSFCVEVELDILLSGFVALLTERVSPFGVHLESSSISSAFLIKSSSDSELKTLLDLSVSVTFFFLFGKFRGMVFSEIFSVVELTECREKVVGNIKGIVKSELSCSEPELCG
jgi:hypothetical protein